MANLCYNSVFISGDKETLDALQSKFEAYERFDTFNAFGDSFFEGRVSDATDWYVYGTRYWIFSMERTDDTILSIYGDSAWSPPTELLCSLSTYYSVSINSTFQECGCDFGGYANFNKGEESSETFSYYEWLFISDKDGFYNDYFNGDYFRDDNSFEFFKEHVLDLFYLPISDIDMEDAKALFEKEKSINQ